MNQVNCHYYPNDASTIEKCMNVTVAEMHLRGHIISNLTSQVQDTTRQIYDYEKSSQVFDTVAGFLYLLLILGSILIVLQPLLSRASNPPRPLHSPSTKLSNRPPLVYPPSTPFPNPPPLPPTQQTCMSSMERRMFRRDIVDDVRNVVENVLDERDDPTFKEGFHGGDGNEDNDYRIYKEEYWEEKENDRIFKEGCREEAESDSDSNSNSNSESESLCSGDRSVIDVPFQQRLAHEKVLWNWDAAPAVADPHNQSFTDFDHQQEVARRALRDVDIDAAADANATTDIDIDHRS